MPNQLFLPGDENDVPENVTARDVLRELRRLERHLIPAIEFYEKAAAVLNFFKWAGPTTLIAVVVGLVWLVTPK
jgi:hypothetical protein